MDEHQAYFNVLRAKAEELRPLLAKIIKREAIVQERIELENLMQNPARLTDRSQSAREDRKREEAMTNRVRNLDRLTDEVDNDYMQCNKVTDYEYHNQVLAGVQNWEKQHGPFIYMVKHAKQIYTD